MSRNKNKPDTATGVIVVNKPSGITSHRVVSVMRKLYDTPRVGHTGTLDPLATGVLPIMLGRAVKASDYLICEDKTYKAEMRLGVETDTEDITGEILRTCDIIPDEAAVTAAAMSFVGDIMQTPPMYSAIWVNGQRLYDIARAGGEVERPARAVTIHSLDIAKKSADTYEMTVSCSKGTYIRTLCADIGRALGCGAALSALCRVCSGSFTLESSYTLESLEEMTLEERIAAVMPTEKLFLSFLRLDVGDFHKKLITSGEKLWQAKLKTNFELNSLVRVYHNGRFIALGKVCEYPEGTAIKLEKLFYLERQEASKSRG